MGCVCAGARATQCGVGSCHGLMRLGIREALHLASKAAEPVNRAVRWGWLWECRGIPSRWMCGCVDVGLHETHWLYLCFHKYPKNWTSFHLAERFCSGFDDYIVNPPSLRMLIIKSRPWMCPLIPSRSIPCVEDLLKTIPNCVPAMSFQCPLLMQFQDVHGRKREIRSRQQR